MKAVLAALALILLFTGCDNGTSINDGGPLTTGDLPFGTLQGIAKNGDPDSVNADHAGILVTLEGTSFSTTTDKRGWWQIKDLPTRNYTIVYTKPGFGIVKKYSVLVVGGGIVDVKDQRIWRIPDCGAELDAVREDQPGMLYAYAHTLCPSSPLNDQVTFFFSNSPNVSSSNYSKYKFSYAPSGQVISARLEEYDFVSLNKKETIYVVAYHNLGDKYYDPNLRLDVFPDVNPQHSRVLSVLMED